MVYAPFGGSWMPYCGSSGPFEKTIDFGSQENVEDRGTSTSPPLLQIYDVQPEKQWK